MEPASDGPVLDVKLFSMIDRHADGRTRPPEDGVGAEDNAGGRKIPINIPNMVVLFYTWRITNTLRFPQGFVNPNTRHERVN